MAAIAYITDAKLLEYHRLNQNHEMNFWRLSPTLKFSDFKEGDLLFFLSKDKDHKRKSEKGIIGYGRCVSFHSAGVNTMWKRYGLKNGYTTISQFKEAIIKVTKDHHLPSKISSIYLEDVVFFQSPIYLSDCGKKVSKSVESYIYIDNDEELISLKILEKAKDVIDIWSSADVDELTIEKEEIRSVLYHVYDKIGLIYPNPKKAIKAMRDYLSENPDVHYIKNAKTEAYKIEEDRLYIYMAPLFIKDKMMERRIAIGQKTLYERSFDELYPYNLHIIFKVIEKDD